MGMPITFPDNGCALVFGGSGGAGAAICELLAKAGTPIAMTYFKGKKRAEATLSRLADITDKPVTAYAVDGRKSDQIQAIVDEAAARHDGIHSVIYAGGPIFDFTEISQVRPERFKEILDADVGSFFNLLHASALHLRSSQGSFTACVTFANRRVLDFDGLSAVPKAAIESVIHQYAAEEGRYGVRANTVALGWIDVGVGSVESEQSVHEAFGEKGMEALRQSIRMKRPGTGEELASAVVFAASQQASYLTGQRIIVDGGASL